MDSLPNLFLRFTEEKKQPQKVISLLAIGAAIAMFAYSVISSLAVGVPTSFCGELSKIECADLISVETSTEDLKYCFTKYTEISPKLPSLKVGNPSTVDQCGVSRGTASFFFDIPNVNFIQRVFYACVGKGYKPNEECPPTQCSMPVVPNQPPPANGCTAAPITFTIPAIKDRDSCFAYKTVRKGLPKDYPELFVDENVIASEIYAMPFSNKILQTISYNEVENPNAGVKCGLRYQKQDVLTAIGSAGGLVGLVMSVFGVLATISFKLDYYYELDDKNVHPVVELAEHGVATATSQDKGI